MSAKFKVGDRVRVVDNIGSPDEYKVGEICTVSLVEAEDDDFTFGDYIQVEGKSSGMFASRFELVTAAAAEWQPKVGDRVRIMKPESFRHGTKVGDVATVTEVHGESLHLNLEHEKDGVIWQIGYTDQVEPLPVAEQPAALKVGAGKFYRTRDGRKVGPMRVYGGGGLDRSFVFGQVAAFTAPDLEEDRVGGSYTSDGTWLTSSGHSPYDLIDEPATAPATPVAATASNDNAAPAKFKVGDRVRISDDAPYILDETQMAGEIIGPARKGARGSWRVYIDNYDDDLSFEESELSLATAATQQSTAGFTIPLVDDEKDGSTQLTVRITSDFTDLHEQIDYAFERLKKLKKKARKLGIDLQFDKAA